MTIDKDVLLKLMLLADLGDTCLGTCTCAMCVEARDAITKAREALAAEAKATVGVAAETVTQELGSVRLSVDRVPRERTVVIKFQRADDAQQASLVVMPEDGSSGYRITLSKGGHIFSRVEKCSMMSVPPKQFDDTRAARALEALHEYKDRQPLKVVDDSIQAAIWVLEGLE